MHGLDKLIPQVLKNCDISDSQYAGLFSVCGLALRLRDLYKWEKGLDPWLEKDSSAILDWIGEKEQTWEKIADDDYRNLSLFDSDYEPFDTEGINAVLEPHGLFYGAGYARSLKPTFFLARLVEKPTILQRMKPRFSWALRFSTARRFPPSATFSDCRLDLLQIIS